MIKLRSNYKTVFEVRGEDDTTEGRGGSHHIGYFVHVADAVACAGGHGVMGGPGMVREVDAPVVVIYESLAEYTSTMNGDKREAALAKLTDEEKALLGLALIDAEADTPATLVSLVPLAYKNNWESNEYYVTGAKLDPSQVRAIHTVYLNAVAHEARARKVTQTYSDMGHPGSATSLLLEVHDTTATLEETWVPVQSLMKRHTIKVDALILTTPILTKQER